MESQIMPWEAISSRLKNEANDEQLLQLKEWLDKSPENPVILSEIMNTWSLTKHKAQFYEPDKTINWEKLMKRIGHSPNRTIQLYANYRWLAVASVLALVFLVGIGFGAGFFKRLSQVSLIKIIAPEGSKTRIILPDSTYVWLNSGSEIQYPNDFSAENRHVYMKGECFFDVSKDPEHPFIVEGSELQVKVYGTRFNVNESTVSNGTDITLISEKVVVYNLNNELLSKLNPGQQLTYSKGSSWVKMADNPEALTSWINNILIFNNQPFEEVIHYLEKWYGVKIQLDKSLYYDYNYTFKVKTESLREVLELISFITPIEYHIEGEVVTIKYKRIMKKKV
jgi:transmembrane sensor